MTPIPEEWFFKPFFILLLLHSKPSFDLHKPRNCFFPTSHHNFTLNSNLRFSLFPKNLSNLNQPLISLEHHRYLYHSPSKHIQTLNQIPSIQSFINSSLSLSLSIPFSEFQTSKKIKKNKTFEDPTSTLVQMDLHQCATRHISVDPPLITTIVFGIDCFVHCVWILSHIYKLVLKQI